ncbi:MAG: hypothetical protein JNK53_04445 [Phycisphaerae bacterium]|nr:hypothetical protein [Phycisphaerae bacterium]
MHGATPSLPTRPSAGGGAYAERVRLRRALRWILIGIACSLPIHAGIAAWLAATHVQGPGAAERPALLLDLAILPDEELIAQTPGSKVADVESPGVESASQSPMQGAETSPLAGAPGEGTGLADGAAAGFAGVGSLGGGGGGGGLSGGAGSTTFFGIGGTGQRFAYIVDKSGSMGPHMEEAKAELRKSIAALPDYASVYVIFFDSGDPFHFSDKWERVRGSTLARLQRWLREVGPSGGTEPTRAFRRVFQLDSRPDVIFFLSDGEIPPESVDEIRRMNATGRKVTVNSIAFGDDAGGARLRQVAQEAGGEYRHVRPKGGAR